MAIIHEPFGFIKKRKYPFAGEVTGEMVPPVMMKDFLKVLDWNLAR